MQYYRCQNCIKCHPACRHTMIQTMMAASSIESMALSMLQSRPSTQDRKIKINVTCPSYTPKDEDFEEKWQAQFKSPEYLEGTNIELFSQDWRNKNADK